MVGRKQEGEGEHKEEGEGGLLVEEHTAVVYYNNSCSLGIVASIAVNIEVANNLAGVYN